MFWVQLKENIEKFFTWFVEEGKATVRLKEPAVDICLSKVRMMFSLIELHMFHISVVILFPSII